MAAEEHVDSVIAALKIIAKVPRNGKLCVRKGQLCLEHEDQMQGVRRWLRGDGRDITLLHARNTVNSAMKISKTLMTTVSASNADGSGDLTLWALERLCDEMQQCDMGLQNLRTTYAYDSMMVANVDVLCDRLRAHTNELRRFLSGYASPEKHNAIASNVVAPNAIASSVVAPNVVASNTVAPSAVEEAQPQPVTNANVKPTHQQSQSQSHSKQQR